MEMGAGKKDGNIYYYIESDGKVYLVENSGELQLPTSPDSIPFKIIEKKRMLFDDFTVIYCGAVLDRHPEEWLGKDDVPKLDNVHHVVRESINMSFPRNVAEAIIIHDGMVLLTNASRGVTVGFWNLPGGFMEYGESPEDCIVRELREELGIGSKIKELIGVWEKASMHHPYHLLAFVYLCEVDNINFTLDPDEIAEVKWFDIDEALKITKSHFTRLALDEYRNNYIKENE